MCDRSIAGLREAGRSASARAVPRLQAVLLEAAALSRHGNTLGRAARVLDEASRGPSGLGIGEYGGP